MEKRFVREFDKLYEVVGAEADNETTNFEENILMNSNIKGLAKFHIRNRGDKKEYYYNMERFKPLSILKKTSEFDLKGIKDFYNSLIKTVEEMHEFLLYGDNLLLDSDAIFSSDNGDEYLFICLPGSNLELKSEIAKISEFILKKVDYQNIEAMKFILEINHLVSGENWNLSELKYLMGEELLIQDDHEEKLPPIEEFFFEEEETEPSNKNKKKNDYWKLAIGPVAAFCIMRVPVVSDKLLFISRVTNISVIILNLIGMLIGFSIGYLVIHKVKKESDYSFWKDEDGDEDNEKSIGDNETVFLGVMRERVSLVLVDKADYNNNIVITEFPAVVGKSKANADVIIEDAFVSRVHARINLKGEELYVTDLDSSNGTFVNGKKLARRRPERAADRDRVAFAHREYEVWIRKDSNCNNLK